jgi:SWI/SNF-related matrix-associated actin-dependent regulator of chromatin subfamily A3
MAPQKRPSDGVNLPSTPQRKYHKQDGPFNGRHNSSQQAAPSSSQSSFSQWYQSTPPSSRGPSNSQPPRSSWVGENFDDEADVIDLTQDDNHQSPMEFYGNLENKIVGVRYYNGVVTPGEMILCRREAGNPYDSNAIRIDNVMRSQIGHLPRNVVKKLAPYLDRNDIILEGVLTGEKGAFDCPVRLYIYGTSDPAARLDLENRLKADKLLKATQLKATKQEAEARRRTAGLGLKNGTSIAGLNTEEREEQNITLTQLQQASEISDFRYDADILKDFAMNEDALSTLPMAKQPEAVESRLLPYQLQVGNHKVIFCPG